MNYIDPWGLWESLRKLVEQTTGSVSWIGNNNMAGILGEKNTATVKINEKTQKYNVINGKVYVNVNEVGYIENDRIIVDEQDFYQDFDIAGTISICAYWDSEENFYISNTNIRVDSFSGHAYIEFTDLNGNLDTYSTNPAYIQFGTDEGMQKNLESDIRLINSTSTRKYSKLITNSQQTKMLNTINVPQNDTWSLGNNCAVFASKVFKSATGISFNANSPCSLQLAIIYKNK